MRNAINCGAFRPTRLQRFTGITVMLVSALSAVSRANAQDGAVTLSPEQVTLLSQLDAKATAEILSIAETAQTWRTRLTKIQQLAGNADKSAAGAEAENLFKEFGPAAAKLSPEVRKKLAVLDELEKKAKAIENEWKTAAFDATKNPDQKEADFRKELKNKLYAEAAAELAKTFDVKIDKAIKALRDPAQYARNFLENEIRKKYFQKPYEVGDVQFTLTQQELTQSLFSENANIGIEISYQQGLSVKATGLYFKYRQGQALPEPKFDRVKVDQNGLNSLKGSSLKVLGDQIPDLGLPIKISKLRFNGFQPTGGVKPGSLSFDVEMGGFLDFAQSLAFKADGVTIDTNGKVTLQNGLGFEDNTTKVAVGTTGLIFDGYGIKMNPKSKTETLVLSTYLATAAGGKESVALKLTAKIPLPPTASKGITFEGEVLIGGKSGVAVAECGVTISSRLVKGWMKVPGAGASPLKNIIEANFKFKLDKEGFTADGMAAVFGVVKSQMDMAIRFDGSGHLSASRSFKIAGVQVENTLFIRVQKGFKQVDLEANLAIKVDLKLYRADATVAVKASSVDRKVSVKAQAMGTSAEFTVAKLDDITPDRIARELLKNLDDILQNVAKAAARWEKGKRVLLARWEGHWRDTIHSEAKKLGLDKVSTGNPQVDAMLGGISRDGKAGGKWVSDVWKKAGGEASATIKNPKEKLKGLPGAVGRDLSNLGKKASGVFSNPGKAASDFFGGLFGGGGKDDGDSGPSEAEKKAAKQHKQVEDKLEQLAQAADRVRVIDRHISSGARRAGKRYRAEKAEMRLAFHNAVGASEGKGNGALGLTVSTSGYLASINTSGSSGSRRRSSSDVKAAWVEFTNLVADKPKTGKAPKPKARIFVDPLKDASGRDPTTRARHELQKLVERYLPEVEIEGRRKHYESQLAIRNRSKETMTVWVQIRSRLQSAQGYRWAWTPATRGSNRAFRFRLPAGSTQVVMLRYEDDLGENGVESGPLTGSRVRLWAESESGLQWTEYRNRDLWLVKKNPAFGGERAYDAEQPKTYVHTIEPTKGLQTFTERLVAFRNETPETLKVQLKYRSNRDGQLRWWTTSADIAPGRTLIPRTESGLRVRASRMYFIAKGENRRFVRHAREVLWLVKETNGARKYRAERIGRYVHVLKPVAGDGSSRSARVTADRVDIKVGEKVVATARRGDSFEVKKVQGDWVLIETKVDGKTQTGWIQKRNLEISKSAPQTPPSAAGPTISPTGAYAEVKAGNSTIGYIRQGETHRVLEIRKPWYKVEITVDGARRVGWVHENGVRFQKSE